MNGFTLTLFAVITALDPITIASDVEEIQTSDFTMPLVFQPEARANIERIRFFVSMDRGKTWNHRKDFKSSDDRVVFNAHRDGEYWFALQVSLKNDANSPANLADLFPSQKVYVNTERRPIRKFVPAAAVLYEPRLTNTDDGPTVTFRWMATGSDLKPKPIRLSYGEAANGPWHDIAAGLSNTGEYTWRLPPQVPAAVLLRLEVHETTGGSVVAEAAIRLREKSAEKR